MSLFCLSCLVVGALNFALSFTAFFSRDYKQKSHVLWATFGIAVSLWSVGLGLLTNASSRHLADLFLKIHYFGAILLLAIFFHFIHEFLGLQNRRGVIFIYAWSFLLQVLSFGGVLASVMPHSSFNFYTVPSHAYVLFILYLLPTIIYPHWLLLKSYRLANGNKQNQILYLFVGTALGFLGGLTTLTPVFNGPVFPFGMLFVFLYVLVVFYAITVHHLLDITLFARDTTAKVFAWGLLGLPLVMGAMLAHFLGSRPGFLYSRGPGDVVCSVLNYSLALTLLKNYANPHFRNLRRFFFLLGTWELTVLILIAAPYHWSVAAFRFSYAVGTLVLLSWFYFWQQYFGNSNEKFSKALRWGLGLTVPAMWVLSAHTSMILNSLRYDTSGYLPAVEIPGPWYFVYGSWFVGVLIGMGLWAFRSARHSQGDFKKWIGLSYGLATCAAVGYFLYVMGKANRSIFYQASEFLMCLALVGAVLQKMETNEQSAEPLKMGLTMVSPALPFIGGAMLTQSLPFRVTGALLVSIFVPRVVDAIQESVTAWVDQTFVFKKKFGYLAGAAKRAKEIKLLDSLEEALPIAAEQILEVFPCKSCSLIIRFMDQDEKPGARTVKIRTTEGNIIEASRWPDDAELSMLALVRAKQSIIIRGMEENLPSVLDHLDTWLFEAAIPLKAKGEIVGVIVVGPKENGGKVLHGEDLVILQTLAQNVGDQLSSNIDINKFRYLVNNTLHDAISNHLREILGKLELDMPLVEADANSLRRHGKILADLRNMTHQALSAGRKEDDVAPEVDVEKLLKEAYVTHQRAAEQKKLVIELHIDSPLPKVRLNPIQIDRCIRNLLTNAIKYTKRGRITLSAYKSGLWLEVSVSDTGLGIQEELLKRIFEPGYRVPGKSEAMADGTGVGLANVKELMIIMGGQINVKSSLGAGSEFTLLFPLSPESQFNTKAA